MSGSIKIRIEGLNSSKIVNQIIDHGIFLKNIKEKSKYIIFEIDQRDENEFKNVCKRFHKRFDVLSKNSFVEVIKRTKYYFGFVLAIILVSAFVFSFNLYVFDVSVKVSSNVKFDSKKIELLLKEQGVVAGVKKKDIDKLKLQKLILSSDESISACSVKEIGGKLEIEIIPAVLKEEVKKDNIYSKFNAVLTKVDVFAGKTSLKVGDLVKQGDLLIENDNGANGKIFGKVYFSDYLIYNENQQIKEFTGKIFEDKYFEMFDKRLNKCKQINKISNFIEEKCVFYVSKYNFLPLKYVKVYYKEFVYKDIVIKFLEKEKELKEKVYNDVLNKIDERFIDKITNVTYSIISENNLTRLDCFVECEIDLVNDWFLYCIVF